LTVSPDEWDLAPCALLEVDGRRIVTRANQQFLTRTGYTRADVDKGLLLTSLLTPAGRIFYETQLAPMLTLTGRGWSPPLSRGPHRRRTASAPGSR
jgi:PAS domain-containing protein